MTFLQKKTPELSIRRLVSLAILVALVLIISRFSLTIIPKQLVVSAAFLGNTVIGTIAGPFLSFITLAIIDIADIIIGGNTANFIIWWTLMEATQGFLYGLFFYGKKLSPSSKKDWWYVTLATVVIMGLGSFILTPLLIQLYFGTPFWAQYLAGRWIKIFELPVRIVLTMLVLPQLQRIREYRQLLDIA